MGRRVTKEEGRTVVQNNLECVVKQIPVKQNIYQYIQSKTTCAEVGNKNEAKAFPPRHLDAIQKQAAVLYRGCWDHGKKSVNYSCEAVEANAGSSNSETAYSRRQETFPHLYCVGDAAQGKA